MAQIYFIIDEEEEEGGKKKKKKKKRPGFLPTTYFKSLSIW